MTRLLCAILTTTLLLIPSVAAQVDIAEYGESGFGCGLAGAFSSDRNAYGGNFSFTVKGLVDFGVSVVNVTGSGESELAQGGQITFLPLRTRQETVRLNLGGFVAYDKLPGGRSSTNLITLGGLLMLDISMSAKADFQLSGAYARSNTTNSQNDVNTVTLGAAVVSKRLKRNFFLATSVSIPADESYTVFGAQLGFFFKAQSTPNGD